MQDVATLIAQVIATEAGAQFTATPGVAYDRSDAALGIMASALLERVAGTGIDLVALWREGSTLVAHVDETAANEPLCPAAFRRVVQQLSYERLGEVWEGRLTVEVQPVPPTPTPTPAVVAA